MEAEVLEKVRTEEINSLNIFPNLKNYLESTVDLKVQDFFVKYNDSFHGPFDKIIYDESVKVRNDVLGFLEHECSLIIEAFNNDKEKFNYDYGWYESVPARIRHTITIDELAYELCEVIRKIYYVYLEKKFPEKYKTTVAEEFLLRGEL